MMGRPKELCHKWKNQLQREGREPNSQSEDKRQRERENRRRDE